MSDSDKKQDDKFIDIRIPCSACGKVIYVQQAVAGMCADCAGGRNDE